MKIKSMLNKFFSSKSPALSASKGFTLIELLIVIAILGILASGILVAINPLGQIQKARDAVRRSDGKQINDAITRYFIVNGSYPDTTCFWCSSLSGTNWIPSLVDSRELKKVPIDPVNKEGPPILRYLYKSKSDGSDYCLQIGLETKVVETDPNYRGVWDGTWNLRYGPNGPKEGICKE